MTEFERGFKYCLILFNEVLELGEIGDEVDKYLNNPKAMIRYMKDKREQFEIILYDRFKEIGK